MGGIAGSAGGGYRQRPLDSLERCGLRVDPYGAGQGSQVCLRCAAARDDDRRWTLHLGSGTCGSRVCRVHRACDRTCGAFACVCAPWPTKL